MTYPNARIAELHRQLNNAIMALDIWQDEARVPREDVSLASFTHPCGAPACFGGHLARWPEFQALGVQPDGVVGGPIMSVPTEAEWMAGEVSEHLFGERFLFSARGTWYTDEVEGVLGLKTDWEIVEQRLTRQIDRLMKLLKHHRSKADMEVNGV